MPVVVEEVSVETLPDTPPGEGAPASSGPANADALPRRELRKELEKLWEREERVRAH